MSDKEINNYARNLDTYNSQLSYISVYGMYMSSAVAKYIQDKNFNIEEEAEKTRRYILQKTVQTMSLEELEVLQSFLEKTIEERRK